MDGKERREKGKEIGKCGGGQRNVKSKLTEKKKCSKSNRQNDRDKDRKGRKTWEGDNNSQRPRGGLMCEDSVQSSIINPIG